MANPRQQERSFESSAEQVEHKVAEEATRASRNVADFSERAARTNVDMLQSGMETVRHIWQSSAELTSSLAKRSTDQFGRALGLAGGESDATAQQASRNLSAIMQTSQAFNEGVRKVSDEWFKFTRARIERAFEHVDKAMRSRTPQELAAIQTEVVRENLEGMLQSAQHIAQLSQQTANEASRKLSEGMNRTG
jgi:phasin family protein